MNNVVDEIKSGFKNGGMTTKLIFVNVGVFLLISFFEVIAKMLQGPVGLFIYDLFDQLLVLRKPLFEFLTHPWGLFTYNFTHFGLMHLLSNMLFLYAFGRMFEQFFSAKRLLYTYIVAGIFGGLLEVVFYLLLPSISGGRVIGASGAVFGIMIAIAFYRPDLKVSIFGLFSVKILYVALFFILTNLYNVGIGVKDNTAYFAHIGGFLAGYISIKNPFSSTNIVTRAMGWGDRLISMFQSNRKKKGNFTYTTSNTGARTTVKTDEQYNMDKKARQAQIDAILDKISKSGYDSLTKEEKELLFKQSSQL